MRSLCCLNHDRLNFCRVWIVLFARFRPLLRTDSRTSSSNLGLVMSNTKLDITINEPWRSPSICCRRKGVSNSSMAKNGAATSQAIPFETRTALQSSITLELYPKIPQCPQQRSSSCLVDRPHLSPSSSIHLSWKSSAQTGIRQAFP